MPEIDSPLAASIERSVGEDPRLWFAQLSGELVSHWQVSRGVNVESYSTSGHFSSEILRPLVEVPVDDTDIRRCTVLELPHESLQCTYGKQGLVFASLDAVLGDDARLRIVEAFRAIDAIPSLGVAVRELARRTHILRPDDDAFDVSYSDPRLPFSVFVSMPVTQQRNEALRLAEGIIHESMHLQLSLIEGVTPLILPGSQSFYSPWRDVERPVGGVLHGLYVFAVIYQWLASMAGEPAYVKARRDEIEGEVNLIREFSGAHGLTPLGRALTSRAIHAVLGGSLAWAKNNQ